MLCQHVSRLLRRKKKVQMQRKKRQGTKQDIWECQVSKMPGWDETQLTRLVLLKTERRKHSNGCQGTYTNRGYEAGRTGMPIQGQEQKGKREPWFQFGFINKKCTSACYFRKSSTSVIGISPGDMADLSINGGIPGPNADLGSFILPHPWFFFFFKLIKKL